MTLVKMLLNKLNWVPYSDSEQAMILPKKIKVSKYAKIGDFSEGNINNYNSSGAYFSTPDWVTVYGIKNGRYIVNAHDGHIVFPNTPVGDTGSTYGTTLISIDPKDCQIQNGGVIKTLLTHVYQALQSLFRNEVIV
ncbi:hypothetical protein [Lactobacillus sp. HT06-2]|uniref:hypothetical protein n=1 Tax=Lactobacillus sp. HT06-2 TaxID=2080222 RepID=UPI000CD950AC|nr:hypothetical protein [Lactobacillus sp. HT06-2]